MVTALGAIALAAVTPGVAPAATQHSASSPIPVTVRDIVEVVDFSGLAVSPDGRWISYRTEQPDLGTDHVQTRWWVAPIAERQSASRASARKVADGGVPLRTTAGTNAPEAPPWSSKSDAFYFRAQVGGAVQIWKATVDGSPAIQVSSDDGDIRSFALSNDNRRLVYVAGKSRAGIAEAERHISAEGTLVDATVDLGQALAGGRVSDGVRSLERFTGSWFDRAGLFWDAPGRRVSVDLASGRSTTLAGTVAAAQPAPGSTSVSEGLHGDRAVFERGVGGVSLSVVRRDGTSVRCRLALCSSLRLSSVDWVPGSDTLLLRVRDADRSDTLELWHVGGSNTRHIATGPGTLDGGRAPRSTCATSAKAVICVEAAATSPPRLTRIDLATGRRTIIADPNAGLRTRISIASTVRRWFADDHEFTGVLLTAPSTPPKAPLLIDYYECPGFLRGGVGTELPMLPLASAGFVVLCINQARMTGAQNAQASYAAGLAGVRAAIAMLAGEGLIDPKRVGMAGVSFGSEVTTWIAERTDLLAAAAISSQQTEQSYFWAHAMPGRDAPALIKQVWGLGWPDRDPAAWDRFVVARNLDKLRAPLLMQLPEAEARWSMELVSRARRDGHAVELFAFPDAPHILDRPQHQLASLTRTRDWFRFWLQNLADSDPRKTDQYARWRALSSARPEALDRLDP